MSRLFYKEINKMLQKGVIAETHHTKREFLSNIFNRPEKDTIHVYPGQHTFGVDSMALALSVWQVRVAFDRGCKAFPSLLTAKTNKEVSDQF